jgi:hypothetical protein
MEKVNSPMKHCKNFCKCHNAPPVQNGNKKVKNKMRKKI